MKNKIWFHADDYGVTREQSERIIDCYRNGVLNSVSILPNTGALGESLAILDSADPGRDRIRRVLHLNFVEGRPLAGADNVPWLVDGTGYFDKSFIKLLQWNYQKSGAAMRRLRHQLKLEIAAQLRAVTAKYDFGITAIDSHQHYHMIPVIFDCLTEVLSGKEFERLGIRQVRIPADPLPPVMRNATMRGRVPRVNWAKWCILGTYAGRNRGILEGMGMEAPVFFGIFYTCAMTGEVVSSLLPAYKAYAGKMGRDLELMFHPGGLASPHELMDVRRSELSRFYMSDNRYYEAECLKNIVRDADRLDKGNYGKIW